MSETVCDDRSHDSEPCPICLNNMKDTANELNDGGLAVLEKCSHIYHTSCIKAWSDVTNSCPLCKSRFTVLSVFQTYSGCLSYLASDRIVTESMGLLRDERVPNRDQHDATEDFISLDEVYYEDDGVQCTDFCYLRNGAPFTEGFHFSVQCDSCENWFHGCCVGFASELDPPSVWHCNNCAVTNTQTTVAESAPMQVINENSGNGLVHETVVNERATSMNSIDSGVQSDIAESFDTEAATSIAGSICEKATDGENNDKKVQNIFACDYKCGFIGAFQTVAEHEQSCPLKGKATGIRQGEDRRTLAPMKDFLKFSPDLCTVCYDDANDVDQILFCDRCNVAVHQSCYNVVTIPSGAWYCDVCKAGYTKPPKCIFCPSQNNTGAMRRTVDGRWAHSFCALWIPEAGFLNNKTMEPVCSMDKSGHRKGSLDRIPNSVFNTPCDVCGKTGGAILCCSNSKCKSVFHPTCAKNEGFYMAIEKIMGSSSDQIQMAAFCQNHSRTQRSSKFTGRDIEIWLPFHKSWSKARVGYYRPYDNVHTVAYHEDGVIEEIQGLGNYISAKTVRLLDEYTTTPDENAKLHTAGVDLPAYADKQMFWNFPPKSWRCNCCRAFNHESRMACRLCCVDSRKWKDSFTQDFTHIILPTKKRRKLWSDDYRFKASWT